MEPLQLGSGSGNESKFQRFLKTPEGWWSMIPPALLVFAVIWFWGAIVPFLLITAQNTLYLMLYIAAICLLAFVMLDKNVRLAAFYVYRNFIRWMVGLFINIDPMGFQKTYKEELEKKQEEIEGSIGKIRGSSLEAERRNTTTTGEYSTSFNRAKATYGKTDYESRRIYALESIQIKDLKSQLTAQKKRIEMYHFVVEMLSRTRDVCADKVVIVGRDIRRREEEQKDANNFQSAMRSIKGILNGMPGQEFYDESTKILEARYTGTIGDLEQMLSMTGQMVASADVDLNVARAELDQKLSAIMDAPTTKAEVLMLAPPQSGNVMQMPVEQKEKERVPMMRADDEEFRKFFK